MSSTIWFGSTQLTLQSDVTQAVSQDGGLDITLRYVGKWTECLAKAPAKGQAIAPWPGKVVATSATRAAGQKGAVTVTLHVEPVEPKEDVVSEPQYSLQTYEVEKPLEGHPLFNDTTWTGNAEKCAGRTMKDKLSIPIESDSFGTHGKEVVAKYFSAENNQATYGQIISICKNDAEAKAVFLAQSGWGANDTALIKTFFAIYDAGTEAYVVSVPVARRTRTRLKPPVFGKCSVIQTPKNFPNLPVRADGKPYSWLKSSESLDWSGKYGQAEQAEEWKGADYIETSIYPTAADPG
jgi:hypothetical protein